MERVLGNLPADARCSYRLLTRRGKDQPWETSLESAFHTQRKPDPTAHHHTIQNVGVSYAFNLAKGLSIEPEYISTATTEKNNGSNTSHSNTVYLRIQRDF